MTRASLDRPDRAVEPREVQPLGETPHQPGPMIGRQELVEAQRPKLDLMPLRPSQTRPPAPRSFRHPPLGKRSKQSIRLVSHAALREFVRMTTLPDFRSRDSRRLIHRL
jgi:hypothetical protein